MLQTISSVLDQYKKKKNILKALITGRGNTGVVQMVFLQRYSVNKQ